MVDDSPQSYQPYLDELTRYATTEEKKPGLLEAKAEYLKATGEVFEDDKQFEMRMASFLDFYLFDRRSGEHHKTQAEEYLSLQQAAGVPAERLAAFRAFTETIHGLFEVKKLGKGKVRLRELFSATDHEVTERRTLAG